MSAGDLREIEAKLIICSDDPLSVVASITALSSAAGYFLLPQDPVTIHDYYVDTPDGVLRHADFSLRVREIDTSSWLTLKGPPRPLAHGLVERLELELPWSQESLERVVGELSHHGNRFPNLPHTSQATPPSQVLAAMGLEKVQYRENRRQIRNVQEAPQQSGPVLAELSVDSVVYHFENRQVRHYEVEVEAKSNEGVAVLPAVVQDLLDTYPTTLQKWDHGKLSTGRAVEALLKQGSLGTLLNNRSQLTTSAYPEIDRFLEQSRTRTES